ncbi:MAG: peptide chain release factor 1 [Myxococcota bacterium]
MLPTDKLESLSARFREVEELLCRPDVASDPARYQKLMRERADLEDIVEAYGRYQALERQLAEDRQALEDPELRDLAQEEIPQLQAELAAIRDRIRLLLLPKDPNEHRNVILEIRAGTGGDEAALFAGDLFRMYARYAEKKGWKIEIMSSHEGDAGGFKEIIAMVAGDSVFSHLRFEGGVHRVQRVPQTESQGRIHTSTATVAVMPEAEEVGDVDVREEDLEVTRTAASGPGGQGVNTTNSAVQIKHLPTGIIVRCQEQRSQIQNRLRAMQILRAKLLEREQRAQMEAIGAERRSMVGTGERSEKIRTYNYPQNRVTDHRIQLTLHSLDRIVQGELDELIGALRGEHQAKQLEAQGLSADA